MDDNQVMQMFDTKATAIADTVGKLLQKMWWEAEKVRVLTADFSAPVASVVPEWRQLVITSAVIYNEAATSLNELGYSHSRAMFVKGFPEAANYVLDVLTYLNGIMTGDKVVLERWQGVFDLHYPKPSNDTAVAAEGQQAAAH